MAMAVTPALLHWRRDYDYDDVLFSSPSFRYNRRVAERRRRIRRRKRRCGRDEEDYFSCQAIAVSGNGDTKGATIRSREQVWHRFFADPLQWWDNRHSKKNPKQPDFRHKRTMEALWIDSPQNPSWIKERIATLDSLGHIRRSKTCCNDGDDETVQKLCQEGRLKDALYLVECMLEQTAIQEAPNAAYISLLKECTKRKMLTEGKRVHALIVQTKSDSNIFLANALINMYAKCGSPLDAHRVFTAMRQHNVFSWTAIISAYADNGKYKEAIDLYKEMQKTRIAPDEVVFVVVLKACARTAALEMGKQIHSLILEKGFHLGVILQNTLVDMYARCGCLDDARELFNNMSERDVVSWNAMIAGYAQNGLAMQAIALYEQMKQEGLEADKFTFVCVLKACASIGALKLGKQIHSLLKKGFHLNIILQSTLVDMYSKCGCLDDARELFNNMSERDVVSWNAMITGYAQNGLHEEALALYKKMEEESIQANKVTFLCVLKACANIGAGEQGKQIHSLIIQKGYHLDMILQSALVDMYAKCGYLDDARELFNNMSERDVVCWNTMIAGYVQNGLGTQAIALYEQMEREGMEADKVTFICVLKACAVTGALEQGKQMHSLIMEKGFHMDMIIESTLVAMYANCGCLENVRELFNNMSERDVVSWNAMIEGYAQNGLAAEAIALYEKMKLEGMQADKVTLVCLLKACANLGALEQGKHIHSLILENGFHLDVIVQTTLIDMYAKCGCLDDAREIFNNMSERDGVSWNAMIAAYAQNGFGKVAIALYEQMKQEEGMEADEATFVSVLKACTNIGAVVLGKQIHSLIVQKGFHLNMILQSTLVDMYAKCGCLDDAREVFNNMNEPDVVSWNAMIAGYARDGSGAEAIALYEQMKQEPLEANNITFVCVLKACASIGALEQGKQIHSLILEKGFHLDMILQNTLIDMYAKCGCIDDARELFNNMNERNVVSWNAMIAGYGQSGLGMEAIALFEQMKQESICLDDVTYTSILSACSHSGLVNDGFGVFDSMCKYSAVIPTLEHYACVVDLLGRAGWLAEAEELIMKMPIQPDIVVWMSLLGAARNTGNMETGQHAFDHMVKLDPDNAAPYLLLIDIYARIGRMDKLAKMTKVMMNKGLKGLPGCSWIEVDNQAHALL